MENQTTVPTIRTRKKFELSRMSDISYNELFKMYINQCKLRNLAKQTIDGHIAVHRYFCNWVQKDMMCSELSQDLINEWIFYLKDRVKPRTVNSYQFRICTVVKFGIKKGYIKDNITFYHVVEQEHIKEIYSKDELEILLKKPKNKLFATYRTWVIINFLLATGIRATELRELHVQDIDLDNAIINLRHTKNRKPRLVPIATSLKNVMIEYLGIRKGEPIEALFCNIYGEMLSMPALQASVEKYCKKRGVTKHSLHLFRHTFITLSVKKGMSPLLLQRVVGHTTMKMLSNYYQYNPTDLVEVCDSFNPLEDFNPKKKKFR
jgi:integrase/recombinase XerD